MKIDENRPKSMKIDKESLYLHNTTKKIQRFSKKRELFRGNNQTFSIFDLLIEQYSENLNFREFFRHVEQFTSKYSNSPILKPPILKNKFKSPAKHCPMDVS